VEVVQDLVTDEREKKGEGEGRKGERKGKEAVLPTSKHGYATVLT